MIHLVLGASPKERRYSYKATEILYNHGYKVYPLGIRGGKIGEIDILLDFPENQQIDTIAMYLSAENQESYREIILRNLPKRVVFNPGTYNPDFQKELSEKGVEVVNDCVLLMVNGSRY
ncbi:MAG: CoA-binding protein [Bacteroidales bacterium]|nr:CoA-binding protein [Bacteroidales bacterium]